MAVLCMEKKGTTYGIETSIPENGGNKNENIKRIADTVAGIKHSDQK